MDKDMAILKDKLTVIEQKLRTFQNKYPHYFSFYLSEEHPTAEEYEEIDELRKERNKLVDRLDEQTNYD
ncbi:hypothetical protein ACFLW0_05255 [Chloroflexota bacterium]